MLEITVDQTSVNRIRAALDRIDPDNQDGAVKRGIMAGSATALAQLKVNVTGVILKVRTGNLQRSMGMHINYDGKSWVGTVGSGAKVEFPPIASDGSLSVDDGIRMSYANILETGGTIVPVNRQWLTIPWDAAKTPSGAPRFSAAQVYASPGGFGYTDTVILGRIIYGIKGKREKLVPLFTLVKSVVVPAKEYMSATVQECGPAVGEDMAREIERGLN